jgi:hypothetical protein
MRVQQSYVGEDQTFSADEATLRVLCRGRGAERAG